MGLLRTLGLKPRQGVGPLAAPPPAPAGAGADGGVDPLAEQIDTIVDYIDSLPDDNQQKAGLSARLAALKDSHAKALALADAAKRAASLKAGVASAKKLLDKASQVAMKQQQGRFADDARDEAKAVLGQVTALVLGGINDDGPRDKVNAELKKLQAAFDKADKVADPTAEIKAMHAVKAKAEKLLATAQGAKTVVDWVQKQLKPMLANAQTAVSALKLAKAKDVLQKELDGLKADVTRYEAALDQTALQSIVLPRLLKLAKVAANLEKDSAQADKDLAQASKLIAPLQGAEGKRLQDTLAGMQMEKSNNWPVGTTLDALATESNLMSSGAKSLINAAQAAQLKAGQQKQIDELQKRLDQLKPRLDKSNETPVPPFIDGWQQKVRDSHTDLQAKLKAGDLGGAQQAYSTLGARLDTLENFKRGFADFEARFNAAKNGEVKTALALKLVPPDLAASRTKALAEHEAEIRKLADGGALNEANAKLAEWVAEAKAWGQAKKAYDNLHSKDPDAGTLDDLSDAPGGGQVLDALVADLPDSVPQKTMTAAMKARYDINLKEMDHRKGEGADPKDEKSRKLSPEAPDKALKGLYKVLGKVPIKDVKEVEEIVHYARERDGADRGASYQGGVFNDTVELYCGRPDDGKKQAFDKPGEVMPEGKDVDPNCKPVNPEIEVPYFDFATLHEVGHAVDDAHNIMKGARGQDAGWKSHGTGEISKLVAAKHGYDADYIEDMMDSKSSTPPKKRPEPPKGVTPAKWEQQRLRVEAWVRTMRTSSGPWWDAGASTTNALDGRVYHEAYEGQWVSYKLAARAQGVTGYQFRSPAEWFAELYASYHSKKLNPKHPAASWLAKLKAESKAG